MAADCFGPTRCGGSKSPPLSFGGMHDGDLRNGSGTLVSASDDGAYPRRFGREPVLRPGIGAGDGHGAAATGAASAGHAGRAGAGEDRQPGCRRPAGVLLAAACVATPTVEHARAWRRAGTPAGVIGLLEEAERQAASSGSTGNRLRFAHPLLARGVYTDAATAQRRDMHRRLAEVVTEPELQARHLALAAASDDPSTLACA